MPASDYTIHYLVIAAVLFVGAAGGYLWVSAAMRRRRRNDPHLEAFRRAQAYRRKLD